MITDHVARQHRGARMQSICPQVRTVLSKNDYDLNTFCTRCPDAYKIPPECDLSCGWPYYITPQNCAHAYDCPCSKPCSGERAQRMLEWKRDEEERKKYIMDLAQDR